MNELSHESTHVTSSRALRWERGVQPHSLAQTAGEGAPRLYKLDQPRAVVGRADDAEVRLSSQQASRQHAVLTRNGDDYTICDNDSRNGILLNGLRVHSAVLRDGDLLQIADCMFIYHEG
jgi:pSer/pThr/pTyr-binding forkhead associated (FHA) protein